MYISTDQVHLKQQLVWETAPHIKRRAQNASVREQGAEGNICT